MQNGRNLTRCDREGDQEQASITQTSVELFDIFVQQMILRRTRNTGTPQHGKRET